MNNGKICVPVCAPTASEVIEQIKQAEEYADLIEVRFDCADDPFELFRQLPWNCKTYLVTFRPDTQGGPRPQSFADRLKFWSYVLSAGQEGVIIDMEYEHRLLMAIDPHRIRRIVSLHSFNGTRFDPKGQLDLMREVANGPFKIAVSVNDAIEGIPVFNLLECADAPLIPIAMGEAGKWTRILGLANGAYLTYASLGTGKETADGQISAQEMRDVYRVKQLAKETRVYAVIGDPVSSSLSPYIHNAAFADAGEDAVFIPMQVKDLDAFMRRMVLPKTREVELNFAGFAVTMPHKQAVMKYLDEIDPVAEKIGAVNTIKIVDDRFTGYNTDAHGFIGPLKARIPDLSGMRVAVVGGGGAARACVSALQSEQAEIDVFVRDTSKADLSSFAASLKTLADLKFEIVSGPGYDIIVNATPIGMKGPLENETILTADELAGVKFVYDLVTSADKTPLQREAEIAGIASIGGLEMLLAQGARQFEIWTGIDAPLDVMREAAEERSQGRA